MALDSFCSSLGHQSEMKCSFSSLADLSFPIKLNEVAIFLLHKLLSTKGASAANLSALSFSSTEVCNLTLMCSSPGLKPSQLFNQLHIHMTREISPNLSARTVLHCEHDVGRVLKACLVKPYSTTRMQQLEMIYAHVREPTHLSDHDHLHEH